MGGEWKEWELGALLEIKHGFAFKGRYFRDEAPGDILLTPGNFRIGGGFRADKIKFYDGPVDEEYVLSEGDLLVTMTDLSKNADTLGYPAFVPKSGGIRYLHNQRLGKVEIKRPDIIDKGFLFYLLCSPNYRHEIVASATGTTVKHTSPARIKAYRTSLPPLPEQRAIAHILGTLDDKIELNRRMNETLEAMARALFKSWFVDFDSVIDNARTAGNPIPDPLAEKAARRQALGNRRKPLPKPLRRLFPDRFVESELGWIPKGWEVVSFDEMTKIIIGGTPRTTIEKYWHGTIPWASAKDISSSEGLFILHTERTITQDGLQNSNAKLLPAGATVITARGTVGKIRMLGLDMAINQTNYGLLSKPPVGRYFLFFVTSFAINQLLQRAYGTVFSTITTRTLKGIDVVRPPDDALVFFEKLVSPEIEKILVYGKEAQTLTSLRNALLPRLISGKIRVKDAEQFLNERGL